jgi:hypothetical protein
LSRSVEGYIAAEYGYSASPDGNRFWWRRCREHPVELKGWVYVDHAEIYAALIEIYAGLPLHMPVLCQSEEPPAILSCAGLW